MLPKKGNKTEDCQRLTLVMALNQVESTVEGTTAEDFIK
jgi:hypothetical protein